MHSRNIARSLAALLAVAGLSVTTGAQVIQQVLVNVNGEILTKTDLEARQVATIRQRQLQPASDLQLRQILDEMTPELIVGIIDEMLMVQHGRELGYTLGDEQFQQVLASIKTDNDFETDEELIAALEQENMTMADLRRNLERTMIVQRVQQNEVLGRIAVSEEEARRYYDSHLEEFTSAQSVTLREVFVAFPGEVTVPVGSPVDVETRTRAEDIRKRAEGGESFEAMASELSESPSRANAGLIGPLGLEEVVPDLRAIIEKMEPGQLSEAIRTPRGYQVLKLESSTPAQTLPFAEARQQISDRVFTDKRREEFNRYLGTLRSQAIIEWKSAELERAFKIGLDRQAAAGS